MLLLQSALKCSWLRQLALAMLTKAAPLSLFTAGLDGCSYEEQVAMVRQRADLEHQRLSEGGLVQLMCCAVLCWDGCNQLARIRW
jgi:hypothetical protein